MFSDPIFRIALIISLSLHLFALSSGFLFHHRPLERKKPQIEVTYIIQEASQDKIPEKFLSKLPKKYDLPKEELKKASQDKPPRAEEAVKQAVASDKKDDYIEEKDLRKLEDYIQYYELIREKIKRNITETYTASGKEGRVEVVFSLSKSGALKNISVDEKKSVRNSYLKETALLSVKRSAPFPSFPPSLNREELTFSIAIIFKRK